MVLCMCGNQLCWHRSNIAADPGWVKCRLSRTVCRNWVGILSSRQLAHSLRGRGADFWYCANRVHTKFLWPPNLFSWRNWWVGGDSDLFLLPRQGIVLPAPFEVFSEQWGVFLGFCSHRGSFYCCHHSFSDQLMTGLEWPTLHRPIFVPRTGLFVWL